MATVFPPRYFIGWVKFKDGTRLEHPDTQFIPVSKEAALLVYGLPKTPLKGLATMPRIGQPLAEIQYSINCLDGTRFLIETLNHKFTGNRTFINGTDGLPYIYCEDGPLFTTRPSDYVFKDISRAVYPVTQFIS